MSDLIVSVSGVRGIVGQGLTCDVALRFASALGTYINGGRVVVSTDGRPSGEMLKQAVLGGLWEAGCEIDVLDVAPTPTVGIAVKNLQAAGGIQITASHNPAQWNGLKLFASNGAVLSPAEGEKVKHLFESGQFRRVGWDRHKVGGIQTCTQALTWHRDRVLELIDVAKIRAKRFKVFVDANGGAGGPLSRELLASLGTSPTILGGAADGNFAHEPEPTEANLTTVCPKVPQCGADIGFVLDPDSDRLAIIDEKGHYIGEELTLALAVSYRLRQQVGTVVVNMSSSRVVEDICKKFGAAFQRSAVGEANVVAMMQSVDAVIGGEGNGGVIDPRVGWVRDPFIGMGMVLNLMAVTGKSLSALVAELPSYVIVKDKYTLPAEKLPKLYEAVAKRWPEARVNRVDGLRLDWSDRWLHVRPSNTEPVVRVIAEAPTAAEAEGLCKDVGAMVKG